MNRRNFFKAVTGFIAGVCVAFVPKAKAESWFRTEEEVAALRAKKRKPTEFVGDIAGRTFYMDSNNGDDKNTGTNWNQAIKSWKRLDEIMG